MADRRTIRLDLEYDGTDFVGWQVQPNGRSIQGEISRALKRLLGDWIVPVGSGRTDSGTHAVGQVAHFHTESGHSAARIRQALNGLLPPDIAVTAAADVEADFHARYSAISKRYRYRIATAKSAVQRRQVWHFFRSLDLDAMRLGASALVGKHRFDAFCNHRPMPDSFICNVLECCWRQQGEELIFEIEANRFLRHMVRIITGTLVEIGTGRRPARDMSRLLDAGESKRASLRGGETSPAPVIGRSDAGPTAPARGLCLLGVFYDAALESPVTLPNRASKLR